MFNPDPALTADNSDKDQENTIQEESPLLAPIRQDSVTQQQEEDEFNYDLLLPPPNPLPKKTPSIREPLQLFYEYPVYKVPKFVGNEMNDTAPGQDLLETLKNHNRMYREKARENRAAQEGDDDESKAYARLCEFFSEEEKVVYRRRSAQNEEAFNKTCYNLRTQPKKVLEDTEVEGIDKENRDKTLGFESRFESGNLAMASIAGENEYNLILQNDLNTGGFGQWFFFAVMNTKKNLTAKFNILNYRKSSSLHNMGMRVLVYSSKEAKKSNTGWTRTGKAEYFCNNISRENPKTTQFFRTLSFEYTFKHDSDLVFFAYSHPYTYTDLLDYFDTVETDEVKSRYFGRSTLCKTIAGNKCELVTITQKSKGNDCEKKKCIFLTSRVHPGETHSSYVIQGVMDFLLSPTKEAESLREKFIFKIIPMLNPDGVIHGNSRCSLAGCDLNRKWRKPSPTLHPTIYNAKRLASELNKKYGVLLFCDFHGHSKKRDMFFYGCQEGNLPLEVREFAFVLSKVSPLFSYRKSSFFMESYKLGAARIALHQELKIKFSYTLETSFFGPEKTGKHYCIEDLLDFGGKFCKAISLQFSKEGPPSKKQVSKEVEQELADLKQKMVEEFYANQESLTNNEPDSGSESEVSEDELPKTMLKDLMPKAKKKAQSPKKTSKSPQKLIKAIFSPVVEAKSPKIPAEKLVVKEKEKDKDRTLPRVIDTKKQPEKFVDKSSVLKENTVINTPEDNEPESETFCFVVKKVEDKEKEKVERLPKPELRRNAMGLIQDTFPLEPKSPFDSLILFENSRREDKYSRGGKERKYNSNGIDPRKPPQLTGAIARSILPSLADKSPTIANMYKQVRSMKEIKSGRDMRVNGDNIWEAQATEETINVKDYTIDGGETKFSGNNTGDEFEFLHAHQAKLQTRKTRVPYMLEPIGKHRSSGPIETLEKSHLKSKKAIRHPGFQKRPEDDFILYKDQIPEVSREGSQEAPKPMVKSIRELFGSGFRWDKLGSMDNKWRPNGASIEEGKGNDRGFNGMVFATRMNTMDKESLNEEMQSSLDNTMPVRRTRKMETMCKGGNPFDNQDKKVKELKKPLLVVYNNVTAKNVDTRVPGSLVTTPTTNFDMNVVRSLNNTSSKPLFKGT